MATTGYWPTRYWHERYWQGLYWFSGTSTPPLRPPGISVGTITLTDSLPGSLTDNTPGSIKLTDATAGAVGVQQ